MTIPQLLHCYVACLLGNAAHIFFKWRSTCIDNKNANMPIPGLFQFLKDERSACLSDLVCSMVLVYAADEWFVEGSSLSEKQKSIFIFVGFTGSYLIFQAASVTKKRFRQVIDEKTDIADKKI